MDDYALVLRSDLKEILNVLIVESREGLNHVCDHVNNINSSYERRKKPKQVLINTREYSVPKVLKNIETLLDNYVKQCDNLSLHRDDHNRTDLIRRERDKFRKYLVRPYISEETYESLDSILYEIKPDFKEELIVETNSKSVRKNLPNDKNISDTIRGIYDIFEGNDFCFNKHDAVIERWVELTDESGKHLSFY